MNRLSFLGVSVTMAVGCVVAFAQNCVDECKAVSCYTYFGLDGKRKCRYVTTDVVDQEKKMYPDDVRCWPLKGLWVLKPEEGDCKKYKDKDGNNVKQRITDGGTTCKDTCVDIPLKTQEATDCAKSLEAALILRDDKYTCQKTH